MAKLLEDKERDTVLHFLSHPNDKLMVKPPWRADKCSASELHELDAVVAQVGGVALVLPMLQHLAATGRTFATITDLLPAIRASTFYEHDINKELAPDREEV